MNSPFATAEDFTYGKVFSRHEDQQGISESIRFARSKAKSIIRTKVILPILISAMAAMSVFTGTLDLNGPVSGSVAVVPISSIESDHEIRSSLRQSREYLGLTQEEAATFLRVSTWTLRKFEQGTVRVPSFETIRRYRALIELTKFYRRAFGEDTNAVASMLRKPGYLFRGKAPLDYAKEGPADAIFDILAMHARMLA